MVIRQNDKGGENSSTITFTDPQFEELRKLIQSYIRVTALGAIEISDKEAERNARLLDAAVFSQTEIGKILHRAQSNVSDLLSGKIAGNRGKTP